MTISLFLAIVIVMGTLIVVTSIVRFHRLQIHVAATSVPAPPKPYRDRRIGHAAHGAVDARGVWALAAQPRCFEEVEKSAGSEAYVRAHLPRSARRVNAGRTLTFGSCRILIEGKSVIVTRGNERIVVPAPAELFQTASRLYLLARGAAGGPELRAYKVVSQP